MPFSNAIARQPSRAASTLVALTGAVLASVGCGAHPAKPTPAPPAPLTFPAGFQWGVSTSAEESEGNNVHSDWDVFAQIGKAPPAGLAQNSYALYETDIENTAALHLNSYQFTIEWARLVPNAPADPTAPLTSADVDADAVAHYHAVIDSMIAHGITPVVTVTHFSLPQWVDNPAAYDANTQTFTDHSLGGWTNPVTGQALAQYAAFLSQEYGDKVKWWLTMDEPMVALIAGYMFNQFPPGLSGGMDLGAATMPNGASSTAVVKNMISGHALAYHAMKAVHADLHVSFAHNSVVWEGFKPSDAAAAARVDFAYNLQFLDALIRGTFDTGWAGSGPLESHPEWANTLDFIGVNYYDHNWVVSSTMLAPVNATPCSGAIRDAAGPAVYAALGCPDHNPPQPPGMTMILNEYWQRYHLPLFVTESGFIDTPEGKARRLVQTLMALHEAIEAGAQVLGYSYWTLNWDYEWNGGWSQEMGLYTIPGFGDGGFYFPDGGQGGPSDTTDFTRVPLQPIDDVFTSIASTNAISPELVAAYQLDAGSP